jgi:bacteriorhodopsin
MATGDRIDSALHTSVPPANVTQEQWNKRLLISSHLFWSMAAIMIIGGTLIMTATTGDRRVPAGIMLIIAAAIPIFFAMRLRRYSQGK